MNLSVSIIPLSFNLSCAQYMRTLSKLPMVKISVGISQLGLVCGNNGKQYFHVSVSHSWYICP